MFIWAGIALESAIPAQMKKIPFFYIIQTVFYIIQYTQSHGVNICSFGAIRLQNPNLHLSSYTPPLSQPFNP